MPSTVSGWIWTAQPWDRGEANMCFFRRVLTLEQTPERALCQLSADSRYRFFVNGKQVCLGPRKGDDKVWYYDEVDISSMLTPGENVLSAITVHFPEILEKGIRSVWRKAVPAFYCKLELTTDGKQIPMPAGEDWKARLADHIRLGRSHPAFTFLYVRETACGVPELQGWQRPGYDDSDWEQARTYPSGISHPAVSPSFMKKRPIPFLYEKPCRFTEVFHLAGGHLDKTAWSELLCQDSPINIPANQEEIVEICADRLTTGYLELAVSQGQRAKIEILQAECYTYPSEDSRELEKGDRLDFQKGALVGPTDEYTVGGFGTAEDPEYYEPFWFRAFRFIRLKVTTCEEPLTLLRFTYREIGYPLRIQTNVETSDPTLRDIWQISENSLRACMHETYEDCPFYEQLQYAMDTRAEILFTYNVAADDRLGRQAIDDFARSQRADGLINSCYPAYKPNVIPQFSIYFVLMLHDHMMYFGDKKLVRTYLPYAERVLNFFEDLIDERDMVGQIPGASTLGSCYWGFVDWAKGWELGVPPAGQAGPLTMDSLMYCMALQAAADLAAFIGRRDQSEEYRRQAERLRCGIRTHCTGKDGMLQDGPGQDFYSQHVQVFAALTDTLTGPAAKTALARTLNDPEIPECTVAMGYYLFRALAKTGLYAHTDVLWNKWRKMLEQHLTTCVESDGSYARSDCHAWGAVALYELPAVVLGIRPAKPGYEAVVFDPVPGYLTWAKGQVITPKGLISASWIIEDGQIKKEISLPEGLLLAESTTEEE